jgi:argininosuccinate lyase
MPQKKNPDFAELIRGKSGRVVGDLVAMLMTLKSLPLAYNKDLQEDKEGAMDAADTLEDCYVCAAGMISTMQIHSDAMFAACKTGHLAATDIADYLAKHGMPFRNAHEVVGKLVLLCDKRGCSLDDLTQEDFEAASELFVQGEEGSAAIAYCLDIGSIVNARTTYGGTARIQVEAQLDEVLARLDVDRASL